MAIHTNKTLTSLIAELQAVLNTHGDLPIGGEDTVGVSVTVCDEEGCEAGHYGRPAHHVFVEAV